MTGMDFAIGAATVVSIVVAGAVLVVQCLLVRRHVRDEAWLRDVWLSQNFQPVASIIAAVLFSVGALLVGSAGVAVVTVGYPFGWSLVLLAVAQLTAIGFTSWAALRPFDDDDAADEGAGAQSPVPRP